jgi:hypothetical protein
MRTVAILTASAVVALLLALITHWTVAAIAVVVLAGAGIVTLLRDWRAQGKRPAAGPGTAGENTALRADEFSPDISGHPGGPSSDARADQD